MLEELKYFKQYKKINPNQLTEEELKDIEFEIKFHKKGLISDEYLDFKLWYQGKPSRQVCFANYIEKYLPLNKRILEVGCGPQAKLSYILAEKGYHMTCIDPKINTEYQNITMIKDSFDYRTIDLSHYDYVIAQEPCEAAEHIIRACIQQNTPFIIVLCGVPHPLINGYLFDDVLDWYEYLYRLTNKKGRFKYIKLSPEITSFILTNLNY